MIAAHAPPDARGGGPQDTFRASVTIVNRRGLHARAAAKFVKVAEQFAADVEVVKDDMVVCGISIMGLMVLAAALGAQLGQTFVVDNRGGAGGTLGAGTAARAEKLSLIHI